MKFKTAFIPFLLILLSGITECFAGIGTPPTPLPWSTNGTWTGTAPTFAQLMSANGYSTNGLAMQIITATNLTPVNGGLYYIDTTGTCTVTSPAGSGSAVLMIDPQATVIAGLAGTNSGGQIIGIGWSGYYVFRNSSGNQVLAGTNNTAPGQLGYTPTSTTLLIKSQADALYGTNSGLTNGSSPIFNATTTTNLTVSSNVIVSNNATVNGNVLVGGQLTGANQTASLTNSYMTKALVDIEPVWNGLNTTSFCPYPQNGNGSGGWSSSLGYYGYYDCVNISGTNTNSGCYTQIIPCSAVNGVPQMSGAGINFSRPIKVGIAEEFYIPTNSISAWRLIVGGPANSPQFSDQNALATNGFGFQECNVSGTNMIGLFAFGSGGYVSTNTPFSASTFIAWTITSDGSGNIALYSNSVSVLTLTGGPTNTGISIGSDPAYYVTLGAYGTSTNAGTNNVSVTAFVRNGALYTQ